MFWSASILIRSKKYYDGNLSQELDTNLNILQVCHGRMVGFWGTLEHTLVQNILAIYEIGFYKLSATHDQQSITF